MMAAGCVHAPKCICVSANVKQRDNAAKKNAKKDNGLSWITSAYATRTKVANTIITTTQYVPAAESC